MNHYIVLVLLICCCSLAYAADVNDEEYQRRLAELWKHDGTKRVVTIVDNDIQTHIRKNDLVVVVFWMEGSDPQVSLEKPDMNFLEVVAQLMAGRKTVICICDIMANKKLAQSYETMFGGLILVYNRGVPVVYNGQRGADVFTPFLVKMLQPPVLDYNKGDKKKVDSIDLLKVIAYMKKESTEFKELQKAGLHFQPMIPFFAVTDPKVAKSLHLKKLNTIQLVKPFEKAITFPSKKKITQENIVAFIKENKKERLESMRLENVHDAWGIKGDEYLVITFANKETEGGKSMFSLAKSLAKHFEKNKIFNFIWIDPLKFASMVENWRENFDIDPWRPNIGVVDVHKQTSVWLEREADDDFPFSKAKDFFNKVIKGELTFKPTKRARLQKAKQDGEKVKLEPPNEQKEEL